MDFFSRTAFPTQDPFTSQRSPSLGCPQCAALARLNAGKKNVDEDELSCSKCKKKKKKPQQTFAVEAPSVMTPPPMPPPMPMPASIGQGTPAPMAPPAAPAPAEDNMWKICAGLTAVVGIGILAANI